MIDESLVERFSSLVSQAEKCVVVFPKNASVDVVAAAVALQQLVSEYASDVNIMSPQVPKLSKLPGIQRVVTEMGHENLLISFNYSEEQVDKVSYHIGENTEKFYLTIKPKKGHKPLESTSVEYSYVGAGADCIIAVGVGQLEDLEQLYIGYEEVFSGATIISVGTFAPDFSNTHIPVGTPGFSDAVASLYQIEGRTAAPETATALLAGIEHATRSFADKTLQAEVFERIALLLNSGARRISVTEHTSARKTSKARATALKKRKKKK